MDPTAKAGRRMSPGAYLSKGADPDGAGVHNKREQQRAALYVNPGLNSPGQQPGVPNNPRNFDSHRDAAQPVVRTNLYGDWQKQEVGTVAQEVPPVPAAVRILAPQPWPVNESLALQEGLGMARLQARSGPSPIQLQPSELVLANQPIAQPGYSGYQAVAPLPSAPPVDAQQALAPVAPTAQLPLPASQDLDPRFAPYTVVGNPADGQFPRIGQTLKPGRGKPGSMPQSA